MSSIKNSYKTIIYAAFALILTLSVHASVAAQGSPSPLLQKSPSGVYIVIMADEVQRMLELSA